ncbi:MAG: PQQ-binding-like beta-propeller repeat protein [Nocardioidaceae bacterium]
MTHPLRTTALLTVISLAMFGVLSSAAGASASHTASSNGASVETAASTGLGDWPAYERNVAHSSAAFGTAAITTANAGSLHQVWHWTPPSGDLEASPTVANGLVYIGTGGGTFYALNAGTGVLAWSRTLDVGRTGQCAGKGIEATATVANDPVTGGPTVYAEGARYLYALNASTGAVVWKRLVGPSGTTANASYYNWSSPTVAQGHIYVGLSSRCDRPLIRGGEVEYSQHTGAVLHTYYDMPNHHVGGSIWSSAAYKNGSVWVTTGNPGPGGTFDSYSIVKLNASTMAKQGKWTVNLTAASDDDFGSSPVLFTSSTGTPMAAACNKNGVMYAWNEDALANGPVWEDQVANPAGGACLTSPAWDFQNRVLYIAAPGTTIGGTSVQGSLRAVNPDTGAYLWQTALPCKVDGSPTLDQPGGVVAVPMYSCPTGVTPVIELVNASTGAILGSVPAPGGAFSQPVFAGNLLYVASFAGGLTAYGP